MSKESKESLTAKQFSIGVLGSIGTGKSTLTQFLSDRLQVPRVEENFPENPFLKKFYENPSEYSFRSQLWFLKSTIDQMVETNAIYKTKSVVFDPANEMNMIYAKTHLDMKWMSGKEFNLYKELYKILTEKSGVKEPDLLIWLTVPKNIVIDRIIKRNRAYELAILNKYPEYLDVLNMNVVRFAKDFKGNIISIDSQTDFTNIKSADEVLRTIKKSLKSFL